MPSSRVPCRRASLVDELDQRPSQDSEAASRTEEDLCGSSRSSGPVSSPSGRSGASVNMTVSPNASPYDRPGSDTRSTGVPRRPSSAPGLARGELAESDRAGGATSTDAGRNPRSVRRTPVTILSSFPCPPCCWPTTPARTEHRGHRGHRAPHHGDHHRRGLVPALWRVSVPPRPRQGLLQAGNGSLLA